MKKLIIAAGLSALLAVPAMAQDVTVDEIIAKNIEARGGMDAITSIDDMRAEGTMTMGPMEAPFTAIFKRPNMVRIDAEVQGMTMTQAFDGEIGWAVMPFLGKTTPEPMAEDQLKDIRDQADLDGPLVNYEEKGHEVEFIGEEDVEGTPAYHLQVTKANGDVENYFLDQDSFLEFRMEKEQEIQGNMVNVSATMSDYKEVDGVLMPHSISTSFEGAPSGQVLTMNSIETGVDMGSDRFAMPEVDDAAGSEDASEEVEEAAEEVAEAAEAVAEEAESELEEAESELEEATDG